MALLTNPTCVSITITIPSVFQSHVIHLDKDEVLACQVEGAGEIKIIEKRELTFRCSCSSVKYCMQNVA